MSKENEVRGSGNGGNLMMWIIKISIPILIAGTLGTVKWVSSTDNRVSNLSEKVTRIYDEGTKLCKDSKVEDVAMKGQVAHMQDDLGEVKNDVKGIHAQNAIIMQQLTRLETLLEKE